MPNSKVQKIRKLKAKLPKTSKLIFISLIVIAIAVTGWGSYAIWSDAMGLNLGSDKGELTTPASFSLIDNTPAPTEVAGDIPRTSTAIDEAESLGEKMIADKLKAIVATSQQTPLISCGNCMFVPLDKTVHLDSNYTPSVVSTGLPGGGSVTPETKAALTELFNAATALGLKPYVTSSYRSYSTQSTVFESWVKGEMSRGKSRADAEVAANNYSARPGQSEHQLGTTADVNCNGCTAFNQVSNQKLYAFIEQNAHKYGFVISYPKGKEGITGYNYEAWHIRYIGKGLAQELFSRNYLSTSNTLTAYKFLKEKQLYL